MATLIHKWDNVYTSMKKDRETVQQLLIETVSHTLMHGNVNVIKFAIDEFPDGGDKKAFADWIVAHAPVDVEYDPKSEQHNVTFVKRSKEENVERFNQGKAKPWYKFARKTGFNGFVLDEVLQNVLAQANNAGKRRQKLIEQGVTDVPEVIASARKLAMIRDIIAMPNDELIMVAEADNSESSEAA